MNGIPSSWERTTATAKTDTAICLFCLSSRGGNETKHVFMAGIDVQHVHDAAVRAGSLFPQVHEDTPQRTGIIEYNL